MSIKCTKILYFDWLCSEASECENKIYLDIFYVVTHVFLIYVFSSVLWSILICSDTELQCFLSLSYLYTWCRRIMCYCYPPLKNNCNNMSGSMRWKQSWHVGSLSNHCKAWRVINWLEVPNIIASRVAYCIGVTISQYKEFLSGSMSFYRITLTFGTI